MMKSATDGDNEWLECVEWMMVVGREMRGLRVCLLSVLQSVKRLVSIPLIGRLLSIALCGS